MSLIKKVGKQASNAGCKMLAAVSFDGNGVDALVNKNLKRIIHKAVAGDPALAGKQR